jgi:hypothetical protein
MTTTSLRVLNLGAGVQSTTLYLMALRGDVTFDVAIFADTQEEPRAVYDHLTWLQSLGGVRIVTATAGRLGEDLMHGKNSTGQRFAAIPAYTTKDGGLTRGMTRRQCSKEYKTEVIARTIRRDVLGLKPRQRVPRSVKVWQAFGITMDEGVRARRIIKRFAVDQKWATPEFPLLDRFMTRADCLTWLAQHGNVPHDVPRSACVFCPFHTDAEWMRVKADPADWARAVAVDEALRAAGSVASRDMRQVMYVHESCKPLAEVALQPKPRDRQMPMSFFRECEGTCGV